MKWVLTVTILAAMTCGLPPTVSAKSKFYNAVGGNIDVFWTAAGCAGIKSSCSEAVIYTVCKYKGLYSGEKSSYSFKDGTSNREVLAIKCSNWNSDISSTKNGGKKGRCAAIKRSNNTFATKCGYTEEEYEQLMHEPLPRKKPPKERRQ